MNEYKNKSTVISRIALLVYFLILVFLELPIGMYINHVSPAFDTNSLKTAKVIKLKNAYFNADGKLVGMLSKNHQARYQVQKDYNIKLDNSGNTSIYSIPSADHPNDDKFAIQKKDKAKIISINLKKDNEVHKLEAIQTKLAIVIIIALVIWIVSLQISLRTRKNSSNEEFVRWIIKLNLKKMILIYFQLF